MDALRRYFWRIMEYLGEGTLSYNEGTYRYYKECSCGDPDCVDEVLLTKDKVIWTRKWGSGSFWDQWVVEEDDIHIEALRVTYTGTVDDEYRLPPV